MDNEDDYDEFNEEDSLIDVNQRQGTEVKPWDIFQIIRRKTAVGSTVENKFIDNGTKFLKILTILTVFFIVLISAVFSKGVLLLMTSQIQKNVTRQYCNKYLDKSRQYVYSVPEIERASWIWLIIFAYFVPELGTFIRSVRFLIFKTTIYPKITEFLMLLLTESLPAIGSSILVFIILPQIDVVKGAMLTNAMSIIPALELVLTNSNWEDKNIFTANSVIDLLALMAQLSALIAWPIIENDSILWLIPISCALISFGWWENFLSETSSIGFVREMAKARKPFSNSKYFCYAIISVVKCLLFFITAILCLYIKDGDVKFLFENFLEVFSDHEMYVTEILPIVSDGSDEDLDTAVSTGVVQLITSDFTFQFWIWCGCVLAAYICYAFGKFACKIMIQGAGFAFPLSLVVPFLLSGLVIICGYFAKDECVYDNIIPLYLFYKTPPLLYLKDFVGHQYAWLWLFWLLSQIWITRHIWINRNSILASTEQLFMRPMYHGIIVDQSLVMNRRNVVDQLRKDDAIGKDDPTDFDEDKITRIYACATMWHETPEEMMEFLKSIFRMDEDQAVHRIARNFLQYPVEGYYEWETHIFFDDAFLRKSEDDTDPILNSYVNDLIDIIGEAASEVHQTTVKIRLPIVYPTPYGGRIVWTLPGKTKLICHLKDKAKIRAKKRWSQVMYMYYLLGHKIVDNDEFDEVRVANRSKNTYLLALDGDIDFQPDAVQLLVQYMKRKAHLGAACGRIHPVGSGPLAWYQVFEYAVGHWMQKATEHVIGCVLCSPGCFSLFRASALMDNNVMARYTTRATEARHYVQYDQGEDRWLCTLLLQRGYRVEYSAASDAYTHCPEGFNEFYNQRRRWMPSTMANILDLLQDSDHIKKVNDDISTLYVWYQMILMIGTIIGPGTIFLMLIGAFVTVFSLSQYHALIWNVVPILIFVFVCVTCKSNTQLFVAAIISAIYGLVMLTVLIGVAMQIKDDGVLAPSSLFFFIMMGEFIIAALIHPKEFYCLQYGIIYLMTVPSMYMLLVIYSVFNMNNVSWGTREVTIVSAVDGQPKVPIKKESFFEKWGNKMKKAFLACRSDAKHLLMINNSLINIQQKVEHIERKVENIELITLDPAEAQLIKKNNNRKSKITIAEGAGASRKSSIRPRPSAMRKSTHDNNKPILTNFGNDSFHDYDEECDDGSDVDDDSSIGTPSVDLKNNSWIYEGPVSRYDVDFLNKKEETFWRDLLKKYLLPIEDDKEKVAQDLKNLRDKMAMSFFAFNVIFVLIVFLLTVKKDILHLQWPFNPKVNFTYEYGTMGINQIIIQQTFLELEPIGFVFLIFFFLLMGIQFIGMIVHRFGTFSQIMANTDIQFGSTNVKNLTEDELLQKDPIKVFRKLVKIKGVNGDDGNDGTVDEHVSRRKTVADLVKNKNKKRGVINDLDNAFIARMAKIAQGEESADFALPRETIAAIQRRRTTILQRKSEMHNNNINKKPFDPSAFKSFENNNYNDQENDDDQYNNYDNNGYQHDSDL